MRRYGAIALLCSLGVANACGAEERSDTSVPIDKGLLASVNAGSGEVILHLLVPDGAVGPGTGWARISKDGCATVDDALCDLVGRSLGAAFGDGDGVRTVSVEADGTTLRLSMSPAGERSMMPVPVGLAVDGRTVGDGITMTTGGFTVSLSAFEQG